MGLPLGIGRSRSLFPVVLGAARKTLSQFSSDLPEHSFRFGAVARRPLGSFKLGHPADCEASFKEDGVELGPSVKYDTLRQETMDAGASAKNKGASCPIWTLDTQDSC
ncbi:hypothetical protein GCM10009105_16590 [Dokdonella soli]|uniref:Uncharacterized protein n=1 Tax=Dokdonella soli TaxID=529810 RepID=A0ABN1IGY3_9GAMM